LRGKWAARAEAAYLAYVVILVAIAYVKTISWMIHGGPARGEFGGVDRAGSCDFASQTAKLNRGPRQTAGHNPLTTWCFWPVVGAADLFRKMSAGKSELIVLLDQFPFVVAK